MKLIVVYKQFKSEVNHNIHCTFAVLSHIKYMRKLCDVIWKERYSVLAGIVQDIHTHCFATELTCYRLVPWEDSQVYLVLHKIMIILFSLKVSQWYDLVVFTASMEVRIYYTGSVLE